MSKFAYLSILKVGIYLSLICVFFVFPNLLFPYITSKQIPFNILMELLLIFWIPFIVKYPEYRPKKSYITFGLVAFLAAITVSSITGVDFNLSFWGDVERMLGVFHVLHFFVFYLIAISIFTKWQDWKYLIVSFLAVSTYIAIDGITGESYSTIGNVAYVAGMMIFAIYLAVLLFLKSDDKKFGSLWLVTIPFFIYEIYISGIGGAYGGLGIGVISAFFLYGILVKNRKIRIATIATTIILVLFGSYFLLVKDNYLVKNFTFFERVKAELNFEKASAQTRLISWRGGFIELKQRPLLGTGFGNYAVIFDKHFDADFYNYMRDQTYFDRAHNNIVDIAATSGIIGLLAYLSIFAAMAYYLIVAYRRGHIRMFEFITLSSLIIAYFVQNLAIFDSFVTYLGLMVVLGYVYWISREQDDSSKASESTPDHEFSNKEMFAFVGAFIIFGTIMFHYNIKPWQMLIGTIEGQRIWSSGDAEGTFKAYKQALSGNTVLDRDSRTSLVRLFSYPSAQFSKLNKEKQAEIMDYTVKQAEANVRYNENDSLNQMTLSQALAFAASLNTNDQTKYAYYSDWSLKAIDKAIEASPERIPVYFQKAQILLSRNQKDEAIKTMEYAITFNDKYYDSYCYLSKIYSFYNEEKKAMEYMDQCIDKGGVELLSPEGYVQNLIAQYDKRKDSARSLKLKERFSALKPKDYKLLIELAKAYAAAGDKEKAIAAVEKAKQINPAITAEADKFINKLK